MTPEKCPFDEALDWIKTIISLPETMNFCGNFSEEYKAGSRDGMRAAAVAAEQALKALIAARDEGKDKGEKT